MKLYLVHCGFYDSEICEGIYESHVNLFVAGKNLEDAKIKVRQENAFKQKKMHIDGLQEVEVVNGFKVLLEPMIATTQSHIVSHLYRDL